MITNLPKIELRQLNPRMAVKTTPSYIFDERGNFIYLSNLLILLIPCFFYCLTNHTPGGLIISHNWLFCREDLYEQGGHIFEILVPFFKNMCVLKITQTFFFSAAHNLTSSVS